MNSQAQEKNLQTKIGVVHQIEGSVYTQSDNIKRKLKPGSPIFLFDKIISSYDGIVIITLKHGSQIALDKNSEVTLMQYLTDEPYSFFEHTKGRLYSVVSKFFSKRNNSYRIKTTTAILGVKGTRFLTEINNDQKVTTIWVYAGVVSVKSLDPKIKDIKNLESNQFISVLLGKSLDKPQYFDFSKKN